MDDLITAFKPRKVIARLKSIGQTEFYQARAAGFKPELKFVIREFEYKGEASLKYGDKLYGIKRTYTTGGDIELVCSREVNTNGDSVPDSY